VELIKLIAIITPILVAAATAYLRLFIKSEMSDLLGVMRKEFVTKELYEVESESRERRLSLLETKPARR